MSFHGMDTEQVATLGEQMATIAARVRDLEQRFATRLEQAAWVGADRERFLGQWRAEHAAALQSAAQALETASAIAAANVSDQERVSS